MYIPDYYRAEAPRKTVDNYPFATLITSGKDGSSATAVPLYFKSDGLDENIIVGHISAQNPQVENLIDGASVLAVHTGPHSYISASWYKTPPLIPTWNYLIAHVRGTIRTQNSEEEKRSILLRTAECAEIWNPQPWSLADAAPGEVDRLLKYIYAFEIDVQSIEGADKLSQPRTDEDFQRVITELEKRNLPGDAAVANCMRQMDRSPTIDTK